jgi:hypothetical protein
MFKVAFLPRIQVLNAVHNSFRAGAHEWRRVDDSAKPFGARFLQPRCAHSNVLGGFSLGESRLPPARLFCGCAVDRLDFSSGNVPNAADPHDQLLST